LRNLLIYPALRRKKCPFSSKQVAAQAQGEARPASLETA